MSTPFVILFIVLALVLGLLIGYIYRKNVGEKTIGSAEQKAKNLILDAEKKAEAIEKEKRNDARDEARRIRTDAERDVKERRNEVKNAERRIAQKEESIDRKLENIEKKEEKITRQQQEIAQKKEEIDSFLPETLRRISRRGAYLVRGTRTANCATVRLRYSRLAGSRSTCRTGRRGALARPRLNPGSR